MTNDDDSADDLQPRQRPDLEPTAPSGPGHAGSGGRRTRSGSTYGDWRGRGPHGKEAEPPPAPPDEADPPTGPSGA